MSWMTQDCTPLLLSEDLIHWVSSLCPETWPQDHPGSPTSPESSTTSHLPILWTTQSCWQRGQRLFCFTHRDMQQLWKEWLHSPQTTGKKKKEKKNSWVGGYAVQACHLSTEAGGVPPVLGQCGYKARLCLRNNQSIKQTPPPINWQDTVHLK